MFFVNIVNYCYNQVRNEEGKYMPFDISKLEIDRIKIFDGIEYRILEESHSGLLIVAKEEDVKAGIYPLQIFAIPS